MGVGYAETAEHKLSVCEFPDDEHFTNLEALVVQLGPKEALLSSAPEKGSDISTVKTVCILFLFFLHVQLNLIYVCMKKKINSNYLKIRFR